MLQNANFLKKVSSKKKARNFPSNCSGLAAQTFLKNSRHQKKKQGSLFSPQIAGAWGQWNFAVLRDASETPFGLICSRFRSELLEKSLVKKKGSQFPPKLLGPGCPDFLEKFSSKKKPGSQFSPQTAGALGQWNFAVLRDASETPFGLICSRFRNRSPGCPDFLGKNSRQK